jgi:ribonuclease D
MDDYTCIGDDQQFAAYRNRLESRAIRSVAMDLEAEFNLHVYGERFCLLQLYDGIEEAVVDPFTTSIDLIKTLLEDEGLQKITYDSASDRLLLAKAHGIRLNAILDLKPAVEILDLERQDLSSVLAETLGVNEAGSKKRFQRYNWTRRPLDPEAVRYAVRDVRHLFALKDVLFQMLSRDNLMDHYLQENRRRQDRLPDVNRSPGLFRSSRYQRLNPGQRQELKRIYDIRERYAQELDVPPNTVLANTDLFALVSGQIGLADLVSNRRIPDRAFRALKREISDT